MFDSPMDAGPIGTDWTTAEIDLIVADYFDMLALELRGEYFVKVHRKAALQELIRRSKGSIEFKHQNISAVLMRLGMPWIAGYKPMANFQKALVDGVERYIDVRGMILGVAEADSMTGLGEGAPIFIEPPPEKMAPEPEPPAFVQRLVRKFDPAAHDACNRVLGKRGEQKVFLSEQAFLRGHSRDDLARKVCWIAEEDGDGAGYDICSFDLSGAERLIEVKTTIGHSTTPFFLSENERAFSEERPEAFRLMGLYDFARQPKAFELLPPLDSSVILAPANWRASFGAT